MAILVKRAVWVVIDIFAKQVRSGKGNIFVRLFPFSVIVLLL